MKKRSVAAVVAVASAALLSVAGSAQAVPVSVVYSGTVSSNNFSSGIFAGVAAGQSATFTVSFDTDQQGSVFMPPSFVGSHYLAPFSYSYDIGGVTGSGVKSDSFLRFSSDIGTGSGDIYEVEGPNYDIDLGDQNLFSDGATVYAQGTASNPFGVITPNIEDVVGVYAGSVFEDRMFRISALSFNTFDTETIDVDIQSVRIIPAPGAAALLGLGGLVATRRRR